MRTMRAPQPERRDAASAHTPAARRVQAGLRVVRASLAAALDDGYVFVRDLHLPGGADALDAVLVGPRILVIELVMAPDRPLRVRGPRWESRGDDGRWSALETQPGARARDGAARVAYALRSAGLPAYGVTPVIALIGGAGYALERPTIAVLRPAELARAAREGAVAPVPAWPDLALRALLVAASAGAQQRT